MTKRLAHIVAGAGIQRLALIGLSKNVGKTTTTNFLLQTLLAEKLYRPEEIALTSLGLDGEATDALTGLPKPRYVPQAGLLVATTAELLATAEREGAQVERLCQLAGRTALGAVMLARVQQAGRIMIAGPTQLRHVREALEQMQAYGAHLSIVDGAMNRLGAASPTVTDACIVCTGASAGGTPELVARRTADVVARLSTPTTSVQAQNAFRRLQPQARFIRFLLEEETEQAEIYMGIPEPVSEVRWMVDGMQARRECTYILRGALTEELAPELLMQLPQQPTAANRAELVVADGTKIFCHSAVLQRLATRGMHVRVAVPIRILALTINPYAPEYVCTSERLLAALVQALPAGRPPLFDVVSGLMA